MDTWIDVKDRLPTEGQQVICRANKTLCCEKDMEESALHRAIYDSKENEGFVPLNRNGPGGMEYILINVTCWLPDDV